MLQLADLDAQALAERQMVGTLVAAGRLGDDVEWPTVAGYRARFYAHLHAAPEPPRQLTAEQIERNELHQVLGVTRGGR